MSSEISIREITAAETRPIRQQVLRPHQQAHELVFGGDDAPGSFHAGAFDGARRLDRSGGASLVGVASIVREAHAGDANAWRVRGMATLPELRGRGVGNQLLGACLAHAKKQGARLVWCHARSSALAFYVKAGFAAEGEEFELPAIGPHWVMTKTLGEESTP